MARAARETQTGSPMHGFTTNYIRIELQDTEAKDNEVVQVRLGDFNEDGTALQATIVNK
jgi:threonylcarbamoyladenosine tRNA methylthiotransferase MtaB